MTPVVGERVLRIRAVLGSKGCTPDLVVHLIRLSKYGSCAHTTSAWDAMDIDCFNSPIVA